MVNIFFYKFVLKIKNRKIISCRLQTSMNAKEISTTVMRMLSASMTSLQESTNASARNGMKEMAGVHVSQLLMLAAMSSKTVTRMLTASTLRQMMNSSAGS